jgi:hypothetical protein
MKKFFISFLLCLLIIEPRGVCAVIQSPPLKSDIQDQIIGSWRYIGFNYQGEFHPPLDDKLKLVFSFAEDGTSDLSWDYQDSMGMCHRKGEFSIEGNILVDKIVWVDPENMESCGSDPDMQVGRETRTPIQVEGNRFMMSLELSGEPFIYILQRLK